MLCHPCIYVFLDCLLIQLKIGLIIKMGKQIHIVFSNDFFFDIDLFNLQVIFYV